MIQLNDTTYSIPGLGDRMTAPVITLGALTMAQTYTFKIISVCSGGEHITIRVLEDGVAAGTMIVAKSEIADTQLTAKDVAPWLFKKAIQNAGATTAAGRKTAIESAQVVL